MCYWQDGKWAAAYNPAPGEYAIPPDPVWLNAPSAPDTAAGIQIDNARRYLKVEQMEQLAELASQQDSDTWIQAQLELARTWGRQAPEQVRFHRTAPCRQVLM